MTKSLRKMHKSLLAFVNFVIGREEDTEAQALPTQRNQYFN
ncbi:MAG: hypothetical protein WBC91_02505 [Phototrophicaceae bacterium]